MFVLIDSFSNPAYMLSIMTEKGDEMKIYKLATVATMVATFGHLALAQTAPTDALTINVNGVRNGEGAIVIAAFDDAAAFEEMDVTKAVALAYVPATSASVSVTFESLPPGTYAAAAMHDENMDGDLNMNGDVPTEGYAFAAMGPSGLPTRFADAAVPAGDEAVSALKLVYWN